MFTRVGGHEAAYPPLTLLSFPLWWGRERRAAAGRSPGPPARSLHPTTEESGMKEESMGPSPPHGPNSLISFILLGQ